jgi:hypothetical protein
MGEPASPTQKPDTVTFRYRFRFQNGEEKTFPVQLDAVTLSLLSPPKPSYPEWTKLGHHQCPNCPLNEAEHPRCPAAVSLVELVEAMSDSTSHEVADVTIESEARRYEKRTSVQQGVSSLTGLYMATSGCPIMGRLRPMVRHHLPFATVEETEYRVLSMYLLAQYLIAKRGGTPDWELKRLRELYEDIRAVNRAFSERLAAIPAEDANLNALVILDTFADSITFSIDQQLLEELELLFLPHFQQPPAGGV